jgi:UDP-N-acetylmuramoyl-L-alanyl-D-glutamate--2,6-diaminopimelate ligase
MGKFNVYNAMPAVLLAKHLEIPVEKIEEGLKNCDKIPGRMEIINEGQNFTAIVDYAHEGVSMNAAIDAALGAKKAPQNKLFVVFGGDGGGREPRIGSCEAVAKKADFGVVTLSDPFDTDPEIINNFLMQKLEEFGMKKGENCFDFLDRREAIKFVVEKAQEGDVCLFTCKGAEQSIIFKDRVEPWDDRVEVREAIRKYAKK